MNSKVKKGHKTLHVDGLQILTSLGILPEELNALQPIEVNADLNLGEQVLIPAKDDIDQVLDYRLVRDAIIHTCTNVHVNLLETLLGTVAEKLLQLPSVIGVRVSITKLEIFEDCHITVQTELGEW